MRTLALLLLAALAQAQPGGLLAGLAKTEITPAGSMPMFGYANRKCGDSNGVHDPLMAKALVLASGGVRVAIVTADIGSLVSDKLRQDVSAKLGIPLLLLAASHTHSGPQFLPRDGAAPPPYLAELEQKIFSIVETASKSMFPARLSAGRGSIQLGYNRLLPRDDGRSRAFFDNPERVPYGPVDPEFLLLRVEDAEGNPKALLVHYAMHAVVLGPTNCKYSADWPGVMKARIETAMPGVEAMFVQGATGDINPLFMARSGDEQKDFAVVAKMGETIAAEVIRAAKAMKSVEPPTPIAWKTDTLKFSDRWDNAKSLEVGIATVLIGRDVAIAAVPGEPLHRLQTAWKQRAEVAWPFFYGYTWAGGGPWPGYIPDLKSAAHGGYGADNSTRIEVGAGEAVMERHLIHLYGLQGMWKDKPGPQ
jgi:hypothetical protein